MCDDTLVDKINGLNPAQVERVILLLLPRIKSFENEPIPSDIVQDIKSRDLARTSKLMAETLTAQGYPIEADAIQLAINNENSRNDLAKSMLIELAKLPETCEVINRQIKSAEEEMPAPILVVAAGVACSMGLLSASVLVLALKTRSEDAEKAKKALEEAGATVELA